MLEIKITVEIPGLPEAINNLADALRGRPATTVTQNGENNSHIENTKTVNIGEAPFEAAPAPAPIPAPVAPASAPAPAPAPAPTAPSYTVEDIARAGAGLIDQGKKQQLLDLLKRYGVQAVTQLDPSVYPAFVSEMKALGAQF